MPALDRIRPDKPGEGCGSSRPAVIPSFTASQGSLQDLSDIRGPKDLFSRLSLPVSCFKSQFYLRNQDRIEYVSDLSGASTAELTTVCSHFSASI
jgi:hypothetical protein